jgi:hypothetical protein
VDHELEAEVAPELVEPARLALMQLFGQAGLPWLPAVSKVERLFAPAKKPPSGNGEARGRAG